uniref:Uncharacterized protein n=1 Tax=Arundo donax TaxID=35708 RepID=A0A0A9HLZ5_ARUDO
MLRSHLAGQIGGDSPQPATDINGWSPVAEQPRSQRLADVSWRSSRASHGEVCHR